MIFRNALQTPDGTVIESFHRHDYKVHKDANGESYMVDGGRDYLRRSVNDTPAKDLTVESIPHDHFFNRQHFKWGTYGIDGDQPLRRVKLMDMSSSHILAILKGDQPLPSKIIDLFEEEMDYREHQEKE